MFAALIVIMCWFGLLVFDAVDMQVQMRANIGHDDFVLKEDDILPGSDQQNIRWKLNNHQRIGRSLSSIVEPEPMNTKDDFDHFFNSLTASKNFVDDQLFKRNSINPKHYLGLKGSTEYRMTRSGLGSSDEIQTVQPRQIKVLNDRFAIPSS